MATHPGMATQPGCPGAAAAGDGWRSIRKSTLQVAGLEAADTAVIVSGCCRVSRTTRHGIHM